MATGSAVDPRFYRDIEALARSLGDVVPLELFYHLKKAMWAEGRSFKKSFRESVKTRFKTGTGRVGGFFHCYTAGHRLGNLTLGVFTVWDAAPIYEHGGTITGRAGGWLLVCLAKEAYRSGGRGIKRSWRDPRTGKFRADKLENLFAVKVPNGYLLFPGKQVTTKGAARRSGVNVGQFSQFRAQPRFLLIRQTRRQPILRFFRDFAAWMQRTGSLETAVEAALTAAGKKVK